MKKINPYLSGICVAYFLLAIAQFTATNMLSHKIYLTIAAVSTSVAITELIKLFCKYYNLSLNKREFSLNLLKQNLDKLFAPLNASDKDKKNLEKEELEKEITKSVAELKNDLSHKNTIDKIVNWSTIFSYACAMFFIVTIPFRNIPNDFTANKIIGGSTLLCFSLMFINMIVNEAIDKENEEHRIKKSFIEKELKYIEMIYALGNSEEVEKDNG